MPRRVLPREWYETFKRPRVLMGPEVTKKNATRTTGQMPLLRQPRNATQGLSQDPEPGTAQAPAVHGLQTPIHVVESR
jgi:hypothetical protein